MKNQDIQLVVFDIAGTTVQDDGNIADAFLMALQKYGFTVPREEVNKLMGYKKPVAIAMMLQAFYPEEFAKNPELVNEIHQLFIDLMVDFYENDPNLKPMPEAVFVFEQLQASNIKVALNTGFSKKITDAILNRLDWQSASFINFVISSDEVNEGRPSPEMITAIMQHCGISNIQQVAKVGDTGVDVLEGRNSQCGLVIATTTGAYNKESLASFNPDFIINNLTELLEILQLKSLQN